MHHQRRIRLWNLANLKLVIVVGLFMCTNSSSENNQLLPLLSLGVGGAFYEGEPGFFISGGTGIHFSKMPMVLHARLANLGFVSAPNESERYIMETLSNGSERCRDHKTGYFAKTELCDGNTEFKYGMEIEPSYWYLPLANSDVSFLVGPGKVEL